jgi:hypothetical protein
MTKKQRKMIQANSKIDTVVCHACAGYFTPSGLRMHMGSEKCRLATIAKPMKEAVTKEYSKRRAIGKHPIVKNVALALKRRNLETLCALELAPTKLMHTDIDCSILEQYWVSEWVYRIWERYNKSGYTRQAYVLLENLSTLSVQDRESEIGLLLLQM